MGQRSTIPTSITLANRHRYQGKEKELEVSPSKSRSILRQPSRRMGTPPRPTSNQSSQCNTPSPVKHPAACFPVPMLASAMDHFSATPAHPPPSFAPSSMHRAGVSTSPSAPSCVGGGVARTRSGGAESASSVSSTVTDARPMPTLATFDQLNRQVEELYQLVQEGDTQGVSRLLATVRARDPTCLEMFERFE